MKKLTVLFLCLVISVSMTGCSAAREIVTHFLSPEASSAPESTAAPTAEPEAAVSDTPEEEPAVDPTAEPTPEPTPEPPVEEIEAALTLYRTLFETGLSPAGSGFWQLNACDVLAENPAAYSPHGYNPLYWMEGFVLYDLDRDYIPELILETGEVEREVYIFKAENGKIAFKSSALSGNQEEINYALEIYIDEEGNILPYCIGTTGSGACDLDFVDRILPDLTVDPFLRRYKWPDETTYALHGEECDMETHKAALYEHFSTRHLLEKVPFTPFGEDPLAALEEAIHG